MSEIRFGWIGETRRTTLRSLIAAEVADWSREWWIHHASAEVDVQSKSGSHDAGPREALPWISNSELGLVAFYLGGKEMNAIGRHLAGAVGDEDAEWSQHIGQDALEDLIARLHKRAGISKPVRLSRLHATTSLEHARLGAFTAVIALGSLKLGLALDRQLVDRLVPPRATVHGANLVSRHEALGRAPLKIQAVLDFGAVSLTHLSDLRVGEVVVGDRGLDDALEIYVEGRGSIATGYLRRSGLQRAVVLDGVNPEDRNAS
ncbi:FliM/FliN family flagellar motor switch protein [Rhodanobacter koreensis]